MRYAFCAMLFSPQQRSGYKHRAATLTVIDAPAENPYDAEDQKDW